MEKSFNPCRFVPLKFDERDHQRIEEYFLARSSLPFKSLELEETNISLDAKVTGVLEQSNGSIRALVPVICDDEHDESSSSKNASVIDGVLNYCKRRSLAQSHCQQSVSKSKPIYNMKQVRSQPSVIQAFKLDETFDIPRPMRIETITKIINEESPGPGNNPIFCSTPAICLNAEKPNHCHDNEPEIYEETVTTAAQRSNLILSKNKDATFNSSVLIRSRHSLHRRPLGDKMKTLQGKENIVPLTAQLNNGTSPHHTPLSAAISTDTALQRAGSSERFCLHFPSLSNTPKGRMSFQISGSVEWEK